MNSKRKIGVKTRAETLKEQELTRKRKANESNSGGSTSKIKKQRDVDLVFFKALKTPTRYDLAHFEKLIEDEAYVNSSFEGIPCLHRLVANNLMNTAEKRTRFHQLLKLFIKAGANLEVKDDDGDSVLALAIALGHVRALKRLVKEERILDSLHAKNSKGFNLFHILVSSNLDYEVTETIFGFLLENDVNINEKDYQGNTPLHLMIKTAGRPTYLKEKTVKYFKDKHYKFFYESTVNNRPVESIVRLFTNNGVNVNAVNDNGQTPLMLAIATPSQFSMPILYLLITEENVHQTDVNGENVITLALQHRRYEMPNDEPSLCQNNVFAFINNALTLENSLNSRSLLVMHVKLDGETPLLCAVKHKFPISIYRALFNQGARAEMSEIRRAHEVKNWTALFFLLQYSKDTLKSYPIAEKFPDLILKFFEYEYRDMKLLKIMVNEYNFDTAYFNEEDGSVLHRCIQLPLIHRNSDSRNIDMFDYLLNECQTDVNVIVQRRTLPDARGLSSEPPSSTPLVYAFSEGENVIAKRLIMKYANVNLRPLQRIVVNEDLSDALRALFGAGYYGKLPAVQINCDYEGDVYQGLTAEQYEYFLISERHRALPLYKLAANALRNELGEKGTREYRDWNWRPELKSALELKDVDFSLMIDKNGKLAPKIDPIFVHPDFKVTYNKIKPSGSSRSITRR